MDDKLKAILAALAVIVAIGVAIWSGIRAQQPAPHVVGSLVGNPQGGTPKAATAPAPSSDPAMGGGKAASDAN